MSINAKQFRELVVKPALLFLGMYSIEAEDLLIGTAAQESHLGTYLTQMGGGPARGVFQMEGATYNDIWENYLKYHPELVWVLETRWPTRPSFEMMATDLFLAAVMCRLHYRRVKEPIPSAGDVDGLASYWNRYYNCNPDKGTDEEFIQNWGRYVTGNLT